MTMYPKGINPKQMEKMMRQMGVKVEEIGSVSRVVIFSQNGNIVITAPEVTKTKIMGQTMYQVVGEGTMESPAEVEAPKGQAAPEELTGPVITDEDVELVATQANTTKEKARKALEDSGGDIAEAIISLAG
jgi:nascent polypeptide-associated complex subunit alpha